MHDPQRQKTVPAVQNAVAILRFLVARGAPMGATRIARETGLNVSSAFNILRTLTAEGLTSFDPEGKTYRIGMGLMEFAAPILGANPADLMRPLMTEIAERRQIMIALWQIARTGRIVLIDRFAAPRIVQAAISRNSRLPVFAGAIGRCYAAALNLGREAVREGYDGVRWQDPPGFEAYWRDVAQARETGTAFDHGNLFRGLEIVAAVARDAEGTPRLGMSGIAITGQHERADLEAVAASLADAAGQIERNIFGRRDGAPKT